MNDEDPPYGFKERRVSIVVTHPYFDQRTFEYDLTLLRLSQPMLPFQPNILPVCVPDDDDTYVGDTAFVTGWGRLYECKNQYLFIYSQRELTHSSKCCFKN